MHFTAACCSAVSAINVALPQQDTNTTCSCLLAATATMQAVDVTYISYDSAAKPILRQLASHMQSEL
jgi:hypothetical protein